MSRRVGTRATGTRDEMHCRSSSKNVADDPGARGQGSEPREYDKGCGTCIHGICFNHILTKRGVDPVVLQRNVGHVECDGQ